MGQFSVEIPTSPGQLSAEINRRDFDRCASVNSEAHLKWQGLGSYRRADNSYAVVARAALPCERSLRAGGA